MVEITILLNTAREDYPMTNSPLFIFSPTIKSLNVQNLKNFELIIVDALYSEGRKLWIEQHSQIPVKYVNAFPNRYLEKGMVAISSMKNTGIVHSEGELIIFTDDCTEFPPWFTERLWKWYMKGYCPMSITKYDVDSHDSREKVVESQGVVHPPGNWFYGGSSATLQNILTVNGLDESFDGRKGLEDVDLGVRLAMLGARYILDREIYHLEYAHIGVSSRVLTYNGPAPICGYAIHLYNTLYLKRYEVNKEIYTLEKCNFIRDSICPNCPIFERCKTETFKGKFYVEGPGFDTWLSLQESFSLRERMLNV